MNYKGCVAVVVLLGGVLAGKVSAHAQDAGMLGGLTRQVAGEARRASSSNPDITQNGDAKSIAAGGTLTLLEAEGPGEITHFWNTIGSTDLFHGRSIVLRIYYDGAEKPSVESPIGDFFGVGHGAYKDFTSMPVTVSSTGRARTCYWRMPFRKSIRMTVTNESATTKCDSFYYYVDWRKLDTLPEDTLYFHAHYRQEFPAASGKNYTILDTKGRGQYVGTVYSVMQMETGWFGEGDDFFYIDGAETPQLRGTGTEDYFNDAWGFREFCTPFHGVPLYEGVLPGDRMTAYRWHIQDAIPFKTGLHLEIEHKGSVFNPTGSITDLQLGGFDDRADWCSSVAFWYQYPPATFDEPLPPADKRIPPARVLPACQMAFRADPPLIVMPQEPFLMYAPNQEKASIELDFDLDKNGRYRLDGVFMFDLVAGAWQPMLDGQKLGGMLDLYIGNADPRWVNLDTLDLKAGKHTLRFEALPGAGAAHRVMAPNFNVFGFAGLTVLRLDDMEGYQQTMNRLLEKNRAK